MSLPTDAELNSIGVLKRRLIEARVLAPLIAALAEEFGHDRVTSVVRRVITDIAKRQGADLANTVGGNSLSRFSATLDHWKADGALEVDVLGAEPDRLEFNVTRCKYAEMYRELGIPELGAILSCGRDAALIEGFGPDVKLTRTQTILGGAPHCDFRYRLARRAPEDGTSRSGTAPTDSVTS